MRFARTDEPLPPNQHFVVRVLDAKVKSLYSSGFVAAAPAATHRFQTHISRAFIVTLNKHINHRALTLAGRGAVVRAGFGMAPLAATMNQGQSSLPSPRPDGCWGDEDRWPPGEGGA